MIIAYLKNLESGAETRVNYLMPANEVSIRAGPPNRIFDAKGQQVPVQYEIISDDYEKIKKYFINQRELK